MNGGAEDRALAFLRRLLAAGPLAATVAEAQARAEGISSRTLDRARKRLGVVAERRHGRWFWSPPPEPPAAEPANDAGVRAPTPGVPILGVCPWAWRR